MVHFNTLEAAIYPLSKYRTCWVIPMQQIFHLPLDAQRGSQQVSSEIGLSLKSFASAKFQGCSLSWTPLTVWLLNGTNGHARRLKPIGLHLRALLLNIWVVCSLANPLKRISLRQSRGDSERTLCLFVRVTNTPTLYSLLDQQLISLAKSFRH